MVRWGFMCTILIYLIAGVSTARILGVFPMPSVSHQVVFRAYMNELAKRGHEIVIITPNALLPKDRPADNVTEIDVGVSYNIMMEIREKNKHFLKRGAISDWTSFQKDTYILLVKMIQKQFEEPAIKELLNGKLQFDLIVTEAIINYPLIISHFIKAPVIQISSFYGVTGNFDAMGAVSRHPFLHPHMRRSKFRCNSFWEKLHEIYVEITFEIETEKIRREENALLKQYYGPDTPTIDELKNNIELFFVNVHPIFDNNRPVPPSVVYLGALHMQPVKDLPKDLKEYLDGSKRGVVYASFGTNVRPTEMDKDLLDTILDAFEALPYDILWKFDGESLERVPKNVKWQKWFPQRELLMHPNVKAFVMQGGLQSTDEAIDATVPLVGIPFIGDQYYNVNKFVELGIGEQIEPMSFTAEDLANAVKEVIDNDSYKKNIQRLKSVMQDQPETPLERAIWWTEHVLRHGSGRHLRSPAANMSWCQYLMLDVLTPLLLSAFAIFLVVVISIYRVYRFLTKANLSKVKVKRN